MTDAIWKDVEGFPNYEISSNGDFRSKASGKLLSKALCAERYERAVLWLNGTRHQTYIHRLVAKAFVPGEGSEVNHKNGIKTDNRASNLEWVSRAENEQHSRYQLGNLVKPVIATDPATGVQKRYPSVEKTAEDGFLPSSVYKCCYGKRPTHKGLQWTFEDPQHANQRKRGTRPTKLVPLTMYEATEVLRFGFSSKWIADAVARKLAEKNGVTLEDSQ